MRYEIRSDQFCALANDEHWQSWLETKAPDLYEELIKHLKISKSCRSNRELMGVIKRKLASRGFGTELIEFLRAFFPIILKILPSEPPTRKPKRIENKTVDLNNPNKHGVFALYKPYLLSFPHKKIIIDNDYESLRRKVRKFTKTKIYTDWIIIGDRAYVEYFESKFRPEAEKVPLETREINIYKRKNDLVGKDRA